MAAPMRTMLAAAREEACLVSAEALSARAAQASTLVINPISVRAAVKEATAETSILGHHLAATGKTTSTSILSTTTSTVQNVLKDDLPTTLRQAVSQATQAGVEEQGEKAFLTLKSGTGMAVIAPVQV